MSRLIVMLRQGTGLTSGFTELLANWEQVLQSLDRVSAYTAERANEAAVRLAGRERAAAQGLRDVDNIL